MIRELSEGRSSELSVFDGLWTLLKPSLNTNGARSDLNWGGGETTCQTLLLILVIFLLNLKWAGVVLLAFSETLYFCLCFLSHHLPLPRLYYI